jgi:hypothetical protein
MNREGRVSRSRAGATITLITLMGLSACGGRGDANADGADTAGEPADDLVLGPVDGHDLPGVDLDRVQVGQAAPDFTLASLAGPPVTLSSFQGMKNVVLVFYRGHW